MRRLQFRVLCRVFLLRVIDLEVLSAEGDTAKLLGQFAAIFAGISFLFAAPLFVLGGNLPEPSLWTAEHLLIATTITAVGLVSILSWDSLVPDRRDIFVLAPLPIRSTTLFAAKLAAVGAAVGLVILSLNVFSGLGWPLFFAASDGAIPTIRSLAAYWVTVALAGAFTFCLVLGIQGVAVQLLSRQLYLRLSSVLQVAGFCLFVGLYFLEPSLETRAALASPANHTMLACLPGYWFLGLFQQLNGSMSPDFAWLAHRAWTALLVAVLTAICVLFAAYFRTMPKLIEQPDLLPSPHRVAWWPRPRKPTQTAIVVFAVRTLLRSRQHRLIVSFYVGVGCAAVLAYMRIAAADGSVIQAIVAGQNRVTVISTTIMLMCVAVAAIRSVISMPISLRANWVFRLTERLEVAEYVAAVRRTLFLMSVAPAWVCIAIALWSLWPPRVASGHLLVLALFGGCLVELSLSGFLKVPFTCSYLPGKANAHIMFWVSVMLLIPLANLAARVEFHALNHAAGGMFLIVVLGIVLASARWRTKAKATVATQLEFEDNPVPEVFGLKLDRN
jgi:hypothetical protein